MTKNNRRRWLGVVVSLLLVVAGCTSAPTESSLEFDVLLTEAAAALAGDDERAGDLHRRAVRADPLSPTTHYRMGLFAVSQGDLEAAAAYLLLASVLWPEDAATHEKLGLVMAERGRLGCGRHRRHP